MTTSGNEYDVEVSLKVEDGKFSEPSQSHRGEGYDAGECIPILQ